MFYIKEKICSRKDNYTKEKFSTFANFLIQCCYSTRQEKLNMQGDIIVDTVKE